MKDDLFISKQSCIIRYKHKTPVYMLVIRLQQAFKAKCTNAYDTIQMAIKSVEFNNG